MPAPSDFLRFLRVGSSSEMAAATTRSHLGDGRVVGWYGDPAVVIDAEVAGRPVPRAIAERFGGEDFWARWTAAECRAKVTDTPMHLWLRRHGLGPAIGVDVITRRWADIMISFAWARDRAQ